MVTPSKAALKWRYLLRTVWNRRKKVKRRDIRTLWVPLVTLRVALFGAQIRVEDWGMTVINSPGLEEEIKSKNKQQQSNHWLCIEWKNIHKVLRWLWGSNQWWRLKNGFIIFIKPGRNSKYSMTLYCTLKLRDWHGCLHLIFIFVSLVSTVLITVAVTMWDTAVRVTGWGEELQRKLRRKELNTSFRLHNAPLHIKGVKQCFETMTRIWHQPICSCSNNITRFRIRFFNNSICNVYTTT